MSRRDLLRAGTAAATGLLWAQAPGSGGLVDALAQRPLAIDVHAHLFPEAYLDLVQGYGKTDTGTQRGRRAGIAPGEMDARFALMDAAGVDMQILSVSPQVPHFDIKANAVTAAKTANDMLADVAHRWPQRFRFFAALPMPHIDESLKEMERAFGLGAVGVGLSTVILERQLADAAFMPVYEEMNRRATVLFLHPAGNAVYSKLIADYHLTWMIGAPFEDTVAALHLIQQGIPTRFPNMKIINSHLGGALPVLLKRLDSITTWEFPQMPEKPSIALRRMYYDTVDYGDTPALHASIAAFGVDKMVLGSDFPYETGDLYKLSASYIRDAGLKVEDTAAVLGGNAARMLRLS
jgi:aminocarboxymuconate-semialdehyde decarboxylase